MPPLRNSTGTTVGSQEPTPGFSIRPISLFAASSPMLSHFWRTVVSLGLIACIMGTPSYPAKEISPGMLRRSSLAASIAPR